ncbi:unnamed protein product, partial [Pylaiella littoralis]
RYPHEERADCPPRVQSYTLPIWPGSVLTLLLLSGHLGTIWGHLFTCNLSGGVWIFFWYVVPCFRYVSIYTRDCPLCNQSWASTIGGTLLWFMLRSWVAFITHARWRNPCYVDCLHPKLLVRRW